MEFDYVVIGAGTAGCVLADRLSASGRARVLLAEAGGDPSSAAVQIPAAFAKLFRSRLDWAFESEPQAGAGNRCVFVPRGRMLGGSANLNAQIHQWGFAEDFDAWERSGASGWGWRDVRPVLEALEALDPRDEGVARGRSGQMRIGANRNAHPAAADFVKAAATGAVRTSSYNGGAATGAWIAEIAHHRGQRFSAFHAFLKPALKRTNLTVLRGAHATRIGFAGRRASGVTFAGRQGPLHARARKGVVLAAGAIGSPHLLMLSGIGPAGAVRALGIDPVADVPGVGEGLHDHPMSVPVFPTLHRDTYKSAQSLPNLLRYLARRRGPLASNAAEAIAFARSSRCARAAPDMELIFAPFEWRDQALQPPRVHAFSIGAVVAAPRSRGTLRLASPDPLAPPRIDFGLFTDANGHDRAVMVEALRWAHDVARHAALAAHLLPAPDLPSSDDAVFEGALATMQTVYHPAGTCRMGSDADAVVRPDLALREADGLWVADASIMPQLPSGHPNAAVAMIAARAADFILAGENGGGARRAACGSPHAPASPTPRMSRARSKHRSGRRPAKCARTADPREEAVACST